jgi:hypothetical protein
MNIYVEIHISTALLINRNGYLTGQSLPHGYLTGINKNTLAIKLEQCHCQGSVPEIKPDDYRFNQNSAHSIINLTGITLSCLSFRVTTTTMAM